MPCLRLSILIPLFFCLVLPLRAQEKPLPVLPQKHTPHRANVLELNRPAERLMTPRPAEWEAEFNRAHSAFRSGVSFLEAKARVDRVLRALPDDAQARKLRAQILIALNRPDEAIKDARFVLKEQPEDGEAHLLVSEAATQTGDREQAVEAMNEAARRLPNDPELWTRLARVAVFHDEVTLAQTFAQAAADVDPVGARAFYDVAMLLMERSREDDAAETLRLGLREGQLDPQWIRQHPTLAPLTRHPRLRSFF